MHHQCEITELESYADLFIKSYPSLNRDKMIQFMRKTYGYMRITKHSDRFTFEYSIAENKLLCKYKMMDAEDELFGENYKLGQRTSRTYSCSLDQLR